ncbi:hypothetical protein ABKN59_009801 [Abortiporus biennis]
MTSRAVRAPQFTVIRENVTLLLQKKILSNMTSDDPVNIDPEFLNACLSMPYWEPDTFFSPTLDSSLVASVPAKVGSNKSTETQGIGGDDSSRLMDKYRAAYMDFYCLPSGIRPCVYKSGPAWRERRGPEAYRIVREVHPVHDHPITDQWHAIGTRIYKLLDSKGVKWTSIDPVAFAEAKGEENDNQEEEEKGGDEEEEEEEEEAEEAEEDWWPRRKRKPPFCPLLIWIGVYPKSLLYETAVVSAEAIKEILTQAGFPEIEVAFRESVVTRSSGVGPKLLSFDPLLDSIPELTKPFTPTLGLPIAPAKTPYYEGTGGLYLRVIFANTEMLRGNTSRGRERVVTLGYKSYDDAVGRMMHEIHKLSFKIKHANNNISALLKPARLKKDEVKVKHHMKSYLDQVDEAKQKMETIDKLHRTVTRFSSTLELRTIGFVLYADPITVSDGPYQFTSDWALIELYENKIDWKTFKGNKIYIGGNLPMEDYVISMSSNKKYLSYPIDDLLQASRVMSDEEIHSPEQVDENGHKCLHVVKNGLGTGTTVGRVNGLDSFTRVYTEYGIEKTSIEVAVLAYSNELGAFSAPGDSGAIVLDKDGGIVGMITGGSGATEKADVTYLTPYWWLEQEIKKILPDSFLYNDSEVVNT